MEISLEDRIQSISKDIKEAFVNVEMPTEPKLVVHSDGCQECDEAKYFLEQFRLQSDLYAKMFPRLRMYLYMLTPQAFQWVLSFYLNFCLSEDGFDSRGEAEFLVYSLRPSNENLAEINQRLSLLNCNQIKCLEDFLRLCKDIEAYEFFIKDTELALTYIASIVPKENFGVV